MSLLDDKGKLFGLINVIDLVILAAVVAILGVGYTLVTKKAPSAVVARQNNQITLTIMVRAVRPDVLPYLKVGDVVKRKETQGAIGAITQITTRPAESIAVTADGKQVVTFSPRDKDAFLTLTTVGRAGKDLIATGNEVVRVGDNLKLVTRWFDGEGFVTGMSVEE